MVGENHHDTEFVEGEKDDEEDLEAAAEREIEAAIEAAAEAQAERDAELRDELAADWSDETEPWADPAIQQGYYAALGAFIWSSIGSTLS